MNHHGNNLRSTKAIVTISLCNSVQCNSFDPYNYCNFLTIAKTSCKTLSSINSFDNSYVI